MKFAILSEKNGKECETWYYFIQYDGNELVLKDLEEQLKTVDLYISGDNSEFQLDLDNLVSETTVNEFLKINTVNSYMIGDKIIGTLKPIDLKIKSNNEKDMWKVNKKLCYGQIQKYLVNA